jgi:DeoR/GlpR family transcriptional regulator of sugar metabolism
MIVYDYFETKIIQSEEWRLMKYKNMISSAERLDGILYLIANSKHVTVDLICQEFKVSGATARRDLEMLSKQGSIQRVHGGAVALHKSPPESPVFQRMNIQSDFKRRIGVAAASLIEPGETLFLGSGTTVLEVAKNIRDMHELTVITNSLLVINELIDCKNITLVDLGGIVRHSEFSMIGNLTEAALSGLYTDKVIIGIHGIDFEQGLTNHYLPETMTDRKLLQMGKKVIIVADHTKCGLISTSQVASISVINTLVTDNEAPQEFIKGLEDRGIIVLQA